ncbi:hypothetical protein [Natrarchaeobaculum sulfurireducens]|uniref:Uncharacterized protein n=1 Tax=Natrarchaeobaculum sulfurireducens TaxID=2044521 RepID=A0A346PH43_9EURY|nr:hypothetical protein [Natrarchaeobaculum sulfurireducens]AXR78838.1 hypothetical protein AArc1_2523 [Natrarchaeobaculum sulfurireducens]AXR81116.1 hypothetical protein AArcMg_1100 [Natrarchaeobaculum sulfurireducens]
MSVSNGAAGASSHVRLMEVRLRGGASTTRQHQLADVDTGGLERRVSLREQ